MEKAKEYETTFTYSLWTIADSKEQAEEIAIKEFENASPQMNIETKEVEQEEN